MERIFINYSREHDAEMADELYSRLVGMKKFDVWMDRKKIKPGMNWEAAIINAIPDSKFFISMLSCKSITGRGFRNSEIREALDRLSQCTEDDIFLIPARLDDCKPPFHKMKMLDRVDLFPDFNKGFESLLDLLGVSKIDKKPVRKREVEEVSMSDYRRVGIVDIDLGLGNIAEFASQLSRIQSYFLFSNPKMPELHVAPVKKEGILNFPVYKVPKSYIGEHRHYPVDLIACISKYRLALKTNSEYHYFAGPSYQDERFIFLSTDSLYAYSKKAGCSFEEGLVFLLVGELMHHFTDLGYHYETKGCVMDFCENRDDIVKGLKKRYICKECNKALKNEEFKEAILELLNWKYRRNA